MAQAPGETLPEAIGRDLVKDGVCGIFIAAKLGVSQPTASERLKVLCRAGFVRAKRIKQWMFCKRDEKAIRMIRRGLSKI